MATQVIRITNVPQDVMTATDIVSNSPVQMEVGKTYQGQFVGDSRATLKFLESATTPGQYDDSGVITNLMMLGLIPTATESIWVWSPSEDGVLVINEIQ